MERQLRLCVYFIGLDSLTERAIRADLSGAYIRRLRPIRRVTARRRGPAPDVVVLDLTSTDAMRERALVWQCWGEQVVVVGVSRRDPMARVWHGSTTLVELAPGFLAPFLPAPHASHTKHGPMMVRVAVRTVVENRTILYPVAAGLTTLLNPQIGLLLALYLLVVLLLLRRRKRTDRQHQSV